MTVALAPTPKCHKHRKTGTKRSDPFSASRRYHGVGGGVLPFEDGSPRRSWLNCAAKRCRQLFRGKLWKCSTIAYLQLQKEAYPALSCRWDPYLAYAALAPGCTEAELDRFLTAEQEGICAMCPAAPAAFEKPSPLAPLATRNWQSC